MFYLRLAILLIPLFTLLAIVMSALGSTQPLHPALRGFVEGCEGIEHPCWHGIVLGISTVQDAVNILQLYEYQFDLKYYSQNVGIIEFNFDYCLSRMRFTNRVIVELFLQNCFSPRVGDLMGIFGLPDAIGYACDSEEVYLRYESHTLIVSDNGDNPDSFSPQNNVDDIVISVQGTTLQSLLRFDWQGFVPNWRYQQLGSSVCVSLSG